MAVVVTSCLRLLFLVYPWPLYIKTNIRIVGEHLAVFLRQLFAVLETDICRTYGLSLYGKLEQQNSSVDLIQVTLTESSFSVEPPRELNQTRIQSALCYIIWVD